MAPSKNIRSKLGLSQRQLAQYLGISRSLVESYELGIRRLTSHALIKLGCLLIMLNKFEAETQGIHKAEQPLLQLNHIINGCDIIASMMTDDHPGFLKHISNLQNTKAALAMLGLKQELLKQQLLLLEYFMKNDLGIETGKEILWLELMRQHKLDRVALNEQQQVQLTDRIYKLQMKYGDWRRRGFPQIHAD